MKKNISEKYLQNYMLIYVWITEIKANINQFKKIQNNNCH